MEQLLILGTGEFKEFWLLSRIREEIVEELDGPLQALLLLKLPMPSSTRKTCHLVNNSFLIATLLTMVAKTVFLGRLSTMLS
jgi:hypothetical protein